MGTGSPSGGRRRTLANFAGSTVPRAGFQFGSTTLRIYGLVLLLFLMLLFLVLFQDHTPTALQKVFTPPPPDAQEQAARRQKLEEYLGGALFDAKDGEGFLETSGYRRLLQQLIDHVRPEDVVKDPAPLNRHQAMIDPDALRGQVVRVRGVVPGSARRDGVWAQKLDQPLFGHDVVWRMVVLDDQTDQGVYVDMMERPEKIDFGRDLVEVDGMFYRLIGFQPLNAKSATERREAPYLLARSVRVVQDERRTMLGSNPTATYILVGVIFMLVCWGVFRVTLSHRKSNFRANQRPFSQLLATAQKPQGDDPKP